MTLQDKIRGFFRSLILLQSVLVAALGLVACEEESTGPGGLARLELGRYSVSFDTFEKSSVTFSLLSTRDWTASCTASWVALTQTEGLASKDEVELTVYVTRNDGVEREAEIIFVNGRYTKIFKIVQAGKQEIVYTPISQVRSCCGTGELLPQGTIVKGVVISDRQLNNMVSYKIAYVQDESAGLQFYFSDQHMLDQGDEISIDLSGCRVDSYYGSVQIAGLSDSFAKVLSKGNQVVPKVVSVEDLLAGKYDGQYVSVENVTVAEGYRDSAWASRDSHTEIEVDASGQEAIYVMTSKYAQSLYGVQVPQGTGTLSGIASIYETDDVRHIRLLFAKSTDYSGLE